MIAQNNRFIKCRIFRELTSENVSWHKAMDFHFVFSSCTTLIVSIFQFASSILRFGAKKLGPQKRI